MAQQSKQSLTESITALSQARKTPTLSLIIPESLAIKHLFKAELHLRGKQLKEIALVIHSGGGDINVAYQIVTLLRRHAQKVVALIPLYAKSAATLLTIAADEIVMGELAELGPLDTQILEYEQGGKPKYNSALNPFKTLEQLQRFSLETLDMTTKMILARSSGLGIDEALKLGVAFVSQVTSPLFTQLKTDKLGEYSRALTVGKEYGDRLLRTLPNWSNEVQRDRILERLVRGYPSHDYIIDIAEMKELGFNVRTPNQAEDAAFCNLVSAARATSESQILYIAPSLDAPSEQNVNGTEKASEVVGKAS